MVKGKKNRKSQFWTLRKNTTLNESFIFDNTLLNEERNNEIKAFQIFLEEQMVEELRTHFKEFCKEINKKIRKLEFNNIYHVMEDFQKFYHKNFQQGSRLFLELLTQFFKGKNGFKTVDLFSESEEFDILTKREKLRLEMLICGLSQPNQMKSFYDFLQTSFKDHFKKEKNQQYSFDYESLDRDQLIRINEFLMKYN